MAATAVVELVIMIYKSQAVWFKSYGVLRCYAMSTGEVTDVSTGFSVTVKRVQEVVFDLTEFFWDCLTLKMIVLYNQSTWRNNHDHLNRSTHHLNIVYPSHPMCIVVSVAHIINGAVLLLVILAKSNATLVK